MLFHEFGRLCFGLSREEKTFLEPRISPVEGFSRLLPLFAFRKRVRYLKSSICAVNIHSAHNDWSRCHIYIEAKVTQIERQKIRMTNAKDHLLCESSTLMKARVARMSKIATINNWNGATMMTMMMIVMMMVVMMMVTCQ